jgi:hypothetical protein
MSPMDAMVMAQQYQAPRGLLQLPTVGLLKVPDISASYTDMGVSDEEIRRRLGLGPTDKITPDMRIQVAGERLKEIPSNMMALPRNIMEAGKGVGSGLLDLFK